MSVGWWRGLWAPSLPPQWQPTVHMRLLVLVLLPLLVRLLRWAAHLVLLDVYQLWHQVRRQWWVLHGHSHSCLPAARAKAKATQ